MFRRARRQHFINPQNKQKQDQKEHFDGISERSQIVQSESEANPEEKQVFLAVKQGTVPAGQLRDQYVSDRKSRNSY